MIVLITGVPGTGKTTLSKIVSNKLNLPLIDVYSLIKDTLDEKDYSKEWDSHLVNPHKVKKMLKSLCKKETYIVETHLHSAIPAKEVVCCVVLQCSNKVLIQRLTDRGYSEKKIRENLECQIMNTVYYDVVEDYSDIIHEINTDCSIEESADKIVEIIKQYIGDRISCSK